MKIDVKILERLKKYHLEDIEDSIARDNLLFGLCSLGIFYFSAKEYYEFKKYLHYTKPNKNLNSFFWDRKPTNKFRLRWLNKHIELNK